MGKQSKWCLAFRHDICTGIFIELSKEHTCICTCHGGRDRFRQKPESPPLGGYEKKKEEKEMVVV